jgi:pyruvate kinase
VARGRHVCDLAGPKVRVGSLEHGIVVLEPGRRFTLTTRPVEGSRDRVSVSYARLPAAVGVGEMLLLADGVIHLRVERVTDEDIDCEVVVGRRLGSRKGVNVPSGLPGLPILGDKDLRDLRVGLEQGIDYSGCHSSARPRTCEPPGPTASASAATCP